MQQEKRTPKDMVGPVRESVVLLHGLARGSRSMIPMAKALSRKGYEVVNLEYPSTTLCIGAIAERYLHPAVEKAAHNAGAIHFVTHSMGGIIVRRYLEHRALHGIGRVVMLAPPNQGSELVDLFKENIVFQRILGPAGQQLSTARMSLPNRLGPAGFDVGIIAGNISFNPLSPWTIDGADDGKVGVKRTRLAGMRDMLVVPCNHTFIMRNRTVIEQTQVFLKTGKFLQGRDSQKNETGNCFEVGDMCLQKNHGAEQ